MQISGTASCRKQTGRQGPQDQGGKHGGQAGMPRRSPAATDQGMVRDERERGTGRGIENERSKSAARQGERSTRISVDRQGPPGEPEAGSAGTDGSRVLRQAAVLHANEGRAQPQPYRSFRNLLIFLRHGIL